MSLRPTELGTLRFKVKLLESHNKSSLRELVKLQNLLRDVRGCVAKDATASIASAYLNGTLPSSDSADTAETPAMALLKRVDAVLKEKYLETLTGEDFAELGFGEEDW